VNANSSRNSDYLARIGTYQWGGKNCGSDMDKGSFQGLDKFPVIAAIFNFQFTDIIMLLPILRSGESPELSFAVGF